MDKKVAIGTGTFEIVIQKGKVQTVTLGNNQNERAIIQVLSNQIVLDRTQAGISDFHPEFARSVTAPLDGLEVDKLILYVDHSSIEVFVNDGRIVLTARVFPQEPYQWVSIQGAEGIVYPLKASTSP
jgi:sucrose-6-phosphate hydrolase SacC (GH32 family)